MKKRILSLLLILCMLVPALAVPASAMEDMGNFVPVRSYDYRFMDVPANQWYYENVVSLYELGLTNGRSATVFGAEDNVTLGQIVSFAARLRSIYYLGDSEAAMVPYHQEGEIWYQPYVEFMKDQGIFNRNYTGSFDRAATRGETAYMLARALPETVMPERNASIVNRGYKSGKFITDVTSSTSYQPQILQLYRWGILTGSDKTGSFHPDSPIARKELAAMLTRMAYPSLRMDVTWDLSAIYDVSNVTFGSLIRGATSFTRQHDINDLAAVEGNVRYMLQHGQNTIELQYPRGYLNTQRANALMDHYLDTVMLYLEQEYSRIKYTYYTSGRIIFTFLTKDNVDRNYSLSRAKAIHNYMWENGYLNEEMTQKEIAKFYMEYLCQICDYDYDFNQTSYAGYGLFAYGSAVCQGYTAAYNLLLKLEGIDCATAEGPNHIWTTATLDGVFCHIDVTWADGNNGIRYEYFAMTPEFSMNREFSNIITGLSEGEIDVLPPLTQE